MNVDISLNVTKTHWVIINLASGYPIMILPVSKTGISKDGGRVILQFGKIIYRVKPSLSNTVGGDAPGPITPETYMAALVAHSNA